MSTPTAKEPTSATDLAVVPQPQTQAPMPVFSGAQMAAALRAYKELQDALDAAMPDQILQIKDRKFRKKGYWRAVSVAFNLTVEFIDEERLDITHPDGSLDWGYRVNYRASAPNGKTAAGDGVCMASEKVVLKYQSDEIDPDKTAKNQTEHNVRSHAHTRAYNRAVSNLVGFGEVSADELTQEAPVRARPATTIPGEVVRSAPAQARRTLTDKQQKMLWAKVKAANIDQDQFAVYLRDTYNVTATRDLAMDDLDKILARVATWGQPAEREPGIEDAPDDGPFA